MNSLLYEKTLKTSMVDKKIHDKEPLEFKNVSNHYVHKRKEIMKKTKFKVEDIFGDVINRDNISQHQINELDKF